jgi:hypothetical protein
MAGFRHAVHSDVMNPLITVRRMLLAFVLLGAALALSQFPDSLHAQPGSEKTMPGGGMRTHDHAKMMADHTQMMAEHTKMLADLKAKDAEIATLLTQLKAASPDQKVTVLSDIVTRMAAQQTTLHAGIERMQPMMKQGGMCPCMDDSDEKPTTAEPQL